MADDSSEAAWEAGYTLSLRMAVDEALAALT